jgi:two-component flavin-dependent monooxygenase
MESSIMTDSPDGSALLRAARDVSVVAAKQAAEAEANRRLHREVVDAVVDAGFARHFVPASLGGAAGTFAELLAAVALIGDGCASTAWLASLTAGTGRMAAYLPADGQAAIWAGGPDSLVVAGLMPAGTAEPAAGRWRVTGHWPYVSGIDFSDWALVCAWTVVEERREARFFAVPREAYQIADTWFNAGMRATGSNTLVLDDVTVPAERSVALQDLLDGLAPDAAAPCHRVPMKAANGLTLTGPLLGAARGALRRWCELVRPKLGAPGGAISGAVDRLFYDLVLAQSAGQIDAAHLLLDRVAEVADQGETSAVATARSGRDCAFAADMLSTAVDRLLRGSGSRGQAEGEELQRHWRDVACGAGHSGLQLAGHASAYSRQVLGTMTG